MKIQGLRALLIQKDVKHSETSKTYKKSLRALLIQKDVKPLKARKKHLTRLRALLIQKDVKLRGRDSRGH